MLLFTFKAGDGSLYLLPFNCTRLSEKVSFVHRWYQLSRSFQVFPTYESESLSLSNLSLGPFPKSPRDISILNERTSITAIANREIVSPVNQIHSGSTSSPERIKRPSCDTAEETRRSQTQRLLNESTGRFRMRVQITVNHTRMHGYRKDLRMTSRKLRRKEDISGL